MKFTSPVDPYVGSVLGSNRVHSVEVDDGTSRSVWVAGTTRRRELQRSSPSDNRRYGSKNERERERAKKRSIWTYNYVKNVYKVVVGPSPAQSVNS